MNKYSISASGKSSIFLIGNQTTNFTYRINPSFSKQQIDSVNQIETKSKIRDRIKKIKELGGDISLEKVDRAVFQNNLILIDSKMPEIISEILLNYYSSGTSDLEDLTKSTEKNNPLKFDRSSKHLFYTYKIKRFLVDVALGMMPSRIWSGEYDATGGYLVVKEDGDVLCYHIYNKNEFENYLLANTKFETASSSRHKFGKVYQKDGKTFIKLNLQIRFK